MEEKQRRFEKVTWVTLAVFALVMAFMTMPMRVKAAGQYYLPQLNLDGSVSNAYAIGTPQSTVKRKIAPLNVSSVDVNVTATIMKKSGSTWKACYDSILLGGTYKVAIRIDSTMDGDNLYYYTENTKVKFNGKTYGAEGGNSTVDCYFAGWGRYWIELESNEFTITGGSIWLDTSEGILWIAESFSASTIKAYAENSGVKKVITLDSAVFPADAYALFDKFMAKEFDLTQGDSSKLTNAKGMFGNCSEVKTIKQNLDTSRVTDMEKMFYKCAKLETLDLSNFKTSNVTTMSCMFEKCSALRSINLEGIDTSKVTDVSYMFAYCSSLTTLDLSDFDTANVTNMEAMFRDCLVLQSIDLSGFNTSKARSFHSLFSGCEQLSEIDLSMFDSSNVTEMYGMFYQCYSLTSLDLSSFNVAKVTDFGYFLYGCSRLCTLDLSSFKPEKATNFSYAFTGDSSLKTIYVSMLWENAMENRYPTSTDMFKKCSNLVGGNGTIFESAHVDREYARIDREGQKGYFTLTPKTAIFEKASNTLYLSGNVVKSDVRALASNGAVKKIVALEGVSLPEDSSELFQRFSFVESIDLTNADASNVKNIKSLFFGDINLSSLKIGTWDVSNVTDLSYLFSQCRKLKQLPASMADWNTENVTSLRSAFHACNAMTNVILTNWKTAKVEDFSNLFAECTVCQTIDVSHFTIKNDADAASMFSGCGAKEILWANGVGNITSDMCLDNTDPGWTLKDGHGGRVGGTGSYVVYENAGGHDFVKRENMAFATVEAITLSMSNAPAPGTKISDVSYEVISPEGTVCIDPEETCWILVDTGRVLTSKDVFQFGLHYVFKARIIPEDGAYFAELPSTFLQNSSMVLAANDNKVVDFVAYHANEDGSIDVYGELYRGSNGNLAGSYSDALTYNLPEGTVYRYSAYAEYGQIIAYGTLPVRLSDTTTVIYAKIPATAAAYCNYMGIGLNRYDISIDNEPYVPFAGINGLGFQGLFPGTEHEIDVRIAGETKPFYSVKHTTSVAEEARENYAIITFLANDGSGAQVKAYARLDSPWVIPDCGFTPAGLAFAAWNIDGNLYAARSSITPVDGMVLNATWENATPLEITKQPRDWYGTFGKKATFTVEATGTELSYQWQYKKSGKWIDYAITTADTATFKVTMNEKNVKWPIRCVITDASGQQAITREVWMKDSTTSAPITITKQPVDWYGIIGKKATFTVEAAGKGLTYQWQYKKGTKWMPYTVATATSATLKVPMNETTIQYPVRCKITDEDGFTATTVEVWMRLTEDPVTEGPVITKQPEDFYGVIGKKASFSVVATGKDLTYQWQYKKGTADWTDYAIATADTANFSVTMNEKNIKWTYRCVIMDADGKTAITKEVHMKLKDEEPAPAGITITSQPGDYTGKIGKKATFTVAATGEGLTYEWQVKKTTSWSAYTLTGYDTPTFQVSISDKTAKWTYRCVIRDASGNEVATNEVRIYIVE